MSRSARITIFKWGYDGWGNGAKELVRSVDAVERDRGHEPPIFVDIRYKRGGRAAGFREHAFEKVLGHARYRWMRSLGNAAIGTDEGGIRIHCKDAAQQLLDLAIDAAVANKRIIFFCSCHSPDRARYCHRRTVANLVKSAANRRRVRVEIEEWPGGVPARTSVQRIRTTETELRKVRRGATTVSLTKRQSAELGALPWGTLVELVSPGESQLVSVGPSQYRARRWHLPIFLFPVEEGDGAASLIRSVRDSRSKRKLDALRS